MWTHTKMVGGRGCGIHQYGRHDGWLTVAGLIGLIVAWLDDAKRRLDDPKAAVSSAVTSAEGETMGTAETSPSKKQK
jgi:hypothetical protein